VEHYRAKKVVIRADGEQYIHLDGEGMVISEELHFEITPSALRILVPQVKSVES
jgi:diacylglycerol kinase family enzyme